jgi:hypothetical protein
MKWYPVLSVIVLATQLAGQDAGSMRAPVLQGVEPSDSLIVTLPGMPAPRPAAIAAPPAEAPIVPAPKDENDHRPLLRRAPRPVLPAEFERDSAQFTQKLIGLWSEPDAYNLFGEPLRERVALDDGDAESGRILAFADPTGKYREIELDFAKDTGLLRTVFVYPWKLTWQDCRRMWGGKVESTEANKGRTFHSYVNRRLDVLVDRSGNVISFGLY